MAISSTETYSAYKTSRVNHGLHQDFKRVKPVKDFFSLLYIKLTKEGLECSVAWPIVHPHTEKNIYNKRF